MEQNSISALKALANGTRVPQADDGIQKVKMVTEAPGAADNCVVPKPTVSNQIDTKNLQSSSGDVVQFKVTNGAATDVTYMIGLGMLNVTGRPSFFGIADAAADEPLVTGRMGASALHSQLFSSVVNGHGYIVKSIKVFGASAAQITEQLTPTTVTPNLDLRRTTGHTTRVDSDLNYAILDGCPTPLSFYSGVLYNIQAGETVTIELDVMAVATIENFSTGLGSC
jgi:hypothetical protein